jgi:flagellar biosynthesis/type III secretory pathway protein FliH
MTETRKYKRRTFAVVTAEAYADGWSKGREAARVEFEAAYQLLAKHSNAMELEASRLREYLANMSLLQLAGTRITGLFRGGRHDL